MYADIELSDAVDRLIVGGALRFERFADFGNMLNWKAAARAELADGLAGRASASTGFRTPTPGQQNAFNVSTQLDPAAGDLVNRGTIPSNSKVTALRGGRGLRPETSMNFTAGTVAEAGILTLTADFFRIAISDRLALSQHFNLNDTEVAGLIAEGVTSAGNLRAFRFFINDFDTLTQRIDIVAVVVPTPRSELSLLSNSTRTDITQYNPDLLSDERIRRLHYTLPVNRLNAPWQQQAGRFSLMGRLSYFGSWYERRDRHTYPGEWLVDFEVDSGLGKGISIAGGAQNALSTFTEVSPPSVRNSARLRRSASTARTGTRVSTTRGGLVPAVAAARPLETLGSSGSGWPPESRLDGFNRRRRAVRGDCILHGRGRPVRYARAGPRRHGGSAGRVRSGSAFPAMDSPSSRACRILPPSKAGTA